MARPGKLTDADKATIRRRYAGGDRSIDLARDYGVSDTTIAYYVSGVQRRMAGPVVRRIELPFVRPTMHPRFAPGCSPRYGR